MGADVLRSRPSLTTATRRGEHRVRRRNPRASSHGNHYLCPVRCKFTEQTPLTVFVATTTRIRNRSIQHTRYKFVTLNRKKFFGFPSKAIGTHKVNISDAEKTLADALDRPEYCGGISEVAKALWNAKENASFDKIVTYATKMENSAILKRLGYLAERLDLGLKDSTLSRMTHNLSPGISPLDPRAPKRGSYLTRWNLLVNVPRKTLDEWKREF